MEDRVKALAELEKDLERELNSYLCDISLIDGSAEVRELGEKVYTTLSRMKEILVEYLRERVD